MRRKNKRWTDDELEVVARFADMLQLTDDKKLNYLILDSKEPLIRCIASGLDRGYGAVRIKIDKHLVEKGQKGIRGWWIKPYDFGSVSRAYEGRK